MQPSWRLPEESEKPFRTALGHAAKRRSSELGDMLAQMSDEQLAGAVGLCAIVSAYTAIDVTKRKWPTDPQLDEIAKVTVEGGTSFAEFGVTEKNVHLWLSQCALGFKSYADVFGDRFDDSYKFLAAPFFLTVNLLATFVPKGQTIWEFLNTIETAYEAAWQADLNLLPALMVRARMPQAEQTLGATPGNK